jgi:hypothetical protein
MSGATPNNYQQDDSENETLTFLRSTTSTNAKTPYARLTPSWYIPGAVGVGA